jgi:hypothetical protein
VGGGNLGEAGLDLEEVSIRKLVFKFQMNLDVGKNLRNFTRKFRRNLDMGIFLIFLGFSRIFRKYNMPCHEWNLRLNFPKCNPMHF